MGQAIKEPVSGRVIKSHHDVIIHLFHLASIMVTLAGRFFLLLSGTRAAGADWAAGDRHGELPTEPPNPPWMLLSNQGFERKMIYKDS